MSPGPGPGEGKFKFWSEHAANANSIYAMILAINYMGCIFYGEQMVIPYAMILQLIGNGAFTIKLNRVELNT